ncbi:MAG: hypothetical protein KYX62_13815 [Pseudomonadota bacterium]|nr:hypothetical protein [Pseudomonadota bacterium]
MKILLSVIALSLLTLTAKADIYGIVEFPLNAYDLVTFSSSQVTARLCDGCEVSTVKAGEAVSYFEKNDPVNLQAATELYVSKKYSTVSLFIDNRTNTLSYIRFGEFEEGTDE